MERFYQWVKRQTKSRRGMRKLAAFSLILGILLSCLPIAALVSGQIDIALSKGPSKTYSLESQPGQYWFGVFSFSLLSLGMIGMGVYGIYRSLKDPRLEP
jgi:hypothetical protein